MYRFLASGDAEFFIFCKLLADFSLGYRWEAQLALRCKREYNGQLTRAFHLVWIWALLRVFILFPRKTHSLPFRYKFGVQGVCQPAMAFSLLIAFRKCCFIPRNERFPQASVLQLIPETEMVIKYVVTTAWALRFGRIPQPVVACPYALGRLHVSLSNAWDKI